jgi:hypothetical protein
MEINLATRIQPKGEAMFIDHHRPDNILSSPQSVQDIMPCVAVNSTVGQPPRASLRAQRDGILECKGLRLLERDPSDIRRDPLFSNTREIWSHERYCVPLIDRLKISVVLEEGPQSILEIEERARPSCDIIRALCALACENLVEISIHERPLGPNTVVRERHSR